MIKGCLDCGKSINATTSQVRCAPCQAPISAATKLAAHERRRGSPRRTLNSFKGNLKLKFGMSLGKYFSMLHRQDYRCDLCHNFSTANKRLAVDHCHSSGKIRSLLCFECNTTLGKVKDSPTLLRRMANYLENHTL